MLREMFIVNRVHVGGDVHCQQGSCWGRCLLSTGFMLGEMFIAHRVHVGDVIVNRVHVGGDVYCQQGSCLGRCSLSAVFLLIHTVLVLLWEILTPKVLMLINCMHL
jgi:hypothetical protein